MKRLVLFNLILFQAILCFAQNNWASEGALGTTTERRYRSVGFSIGSKGYVGTGTRGTFGNVGFHEFNDFWEYDPVTKVWTQLANVGSTTRYDAVGFSIGNKGYIGSGVHTSPTNGDVFLQDFLEYDRTTNTWTNVANILGGPRSGASAFTIGNKAYVGTGFTPSAGYTKDLLEFNPATNTWTQKATFPGVGRYYGTGFGICNKGYIGTGLIANNTGIDDFYEYNPTSNSWAQISSFAGGPCYAARGFSICTKGYVLKGAQSGICDSKKFYEYDPDQNVWTQRADFPSEYRFYPVAFSILNKGYIGTGKKCGEDTYYTDFLSYTPVSTEVPDQPNPISGNTTVCQGTNQIFSIDPVVCAESYLWTIPAGSILIGGQGTTSITVSFPSGGGVISVSGVNGCGMSPARSTSITVQPLPNLITSGSGTICSGTSTTLNASGANTYVWSPAESLNNPNISNPIASPDVSTLYSVIGTTNGCSDTANVSINVNPSPILTVSGSATICQGTSTPLSASGANTYSWTPQSTLSNPSSSSPIASPEVTTTYYVIGSTNGCNDTASVAIFVNPTPEKPDTIYGSSSVCKNTPQTYYITQVPGATGYIWTLPNWPGGSNDTSITSIAGSSGIISVSAVINGCISPADSIYIAVSTIPSSPENIIGETQICGLISYTFSVSPVPGASSYIWSLPPEWSTPSSSNAITVQAGQSGVISVSASNQCGNSVPQSLEVIVYDSFPAQPSLLIGDNTPCINTFELYEITSSDDANAYSWLMPANWSGASTSSSILPLVGSMSGNIIATAHNTCGQSTPLSIPVSVVNIDTTIVNAGSQLVAQEQNATYQWMDCNTLVPIPGEISQTFTPTYNGSYAVIISEDECVDTSGCHLIEITALQHLDSNPSISIYPNPCSGRFYIGSNSLITSISIYDFLGRPVLFNKDITSQGIYIELNDSSVGLFHIELFTHEARYSETILKI